MTLIFKRKGIVKEEYIIDDSISVVFDKDENIISVTTIYSQTEILQKEVKPGLDKLTIKW